MNKSKLHNYILNLDSGTTNENMLTFISDYLKEYPLFKDSILNFIDEIKIQIISEYVVNSSPFFVYESNVKSLNEKKFNDFKKLIQEHINYISNNKKKEIDFNEGSRAVALKFATGAFDKYCDFDAADGKFKLKTEMTNPELGKEVFKNDDFAFVKKNETDKIVFRKTFENNIKNTLSNDHPREKNLRNHHKALKNTIIYCIENNLKISNLFLKICDYCNAKTYNDKEDKCLLYNDLDFMEKFHDHLVKHETLITEYFKERLSNLRINK